MKGIRFSKLGPKFLLPYLTTILLIVSIPFLYGLIYWGRIFPGIYVAGIYLGGLKTSAATQTLLAKVGPPEKITLSDGKQIFEIKTSDIDFSYDYDKSALSAYEIFRSGNPLYDFIKRVQSLYSGVNAGLVFNLNEDKLNEYLSVTAGQIAQEPIYPSVKLVGSHAVVENGTPGKEIDGRALRVEIGQNLTFAKSSTVNIPFSALDPSLSTDELESFQARAQGLVGKKLNLNFEYVTTVFSDKDIFNLLNPKGGYDEKAVNDLGEKIAKDTDRAPQNAVFIYLDGKVQEFTPAKEGVTVNKEQFKELLLSSLSTLETTEGTSATFDIPTTATAPKITTSDVNNLGIRQLIGRGSSHFKGSITSRIHNLTLSASKFNSVLIGPGEIFSFNEALGDVSMYTGYKQAYVIKDGKTVLGDGGGVCQVSTTLFRAALAAGLPIVERRAHSYRVGYYEQDSLPGLDATVYAPTTDLKIKNDTPGHLLIQTHTDAGSSELVFELYGTSDGRVASISKPVVTDPVPPPEDLYQDDPSLPAGVVKQVDWKAWGSRVHFNYQVKRGEEVVYEKTFYSNYHPWQAVFLRGTGPVN